MSAEVLREAAAALRKDYGETWAVDLPSTPFYLRVADWLDACALVTEVAPDRHKGLALAVARAYLGTEAS